MSAHPERDSYWKTVTEPNASNLSPQSFHMLECESITCNNLLNYHFLWVQE